MTFGFPTFGAPVGGAGEVYPVDYRFRVVASQSHVPGSTSSQSHIPGSVKEQSHIPGSTSSQAQPY